MTDVRARLHAWLLATAAACALMLPSAADAQIYVYKDEFGRTHFTDNPQGEGYQRYRPKGTLRIRGGASRARVEPRVTREYDPAIARVSKQHGISPALVKAVIAAESGFDPEAISTKGAQGLMQLMPTTAERMGVDDALDPWQNIEGGTRYLSEMIERFPGELNLALAAYNAGPEAVKRHRGVPPYKETRTYVRRVLRYYEKYHADFRR